MIIYNNEQRVYGICNPVDESLILIPINFVWGYGPYVPSRGCYHVFNNVSINMSIVERDIRRITLIREYATHGIVDKYVDNNGYIIINQSEYDTNNNYVELTRMGADDLFFISNLNTGKELCVYCGNGLNSGIISSTLSREIDIGYIFDVSDRSEDIIIHAEVSDFWGYAIGVSAVYIAIDCTTNESSFVVHDPSSSWFGYAYKKIWGWYGPQI